MSTRSAVMSALLAGLVVTTPFTTVAESPAPAYSVPFRPEEMDQLAAPVALYPDSVLAHTLMAATYPLEIVQAADWAKNNAALKGDQLTAALRDRPWDTSVKVLTHFSQVLQMLDEQPEWQRKLGDAFLTGQRNLLAAVQRLRRRAQEAGTLGSMGQWTVKVERDVILIQPANPQAVYLSAYDPMVAYGVWPYPAYPPAPVSLRAASVVTGVVLYANADWRRGEIIIDENINRYQFGRALSRPATWQHDPTHRAGVPYPDPATARRFGQNAPESAEFRAETRGHGVSSEQVSEGGGRASAEGRGRAFAGIGDGGFDSAASQRGIPGRVGPMAAAGSQPPQQTFSTPEAAARALLDTAAKGDARAIASLLGPDGQAVISTGDEVADQLAREGFRAAAEESLVLNRQAPDRVVITVGKDHWPFPLPIVQVNDGWRFDTAAGRREIRRRQIGKNELRTIEVCRVYVTAQREYASVPREADGVIKFAQHVMSSPGRRDGLYWEVAEGEPPSPLGPLMAAAAREGHTPRKPGQPSMPFHGYFYKILKSQGPNAPGGSHSYLINGNMVAGFALVAWPAEYGSSGTMTFVVNQNGVVYEKDLGPKTGELTAAMTGYDPDRSWHRAQ
jgi:hypothetical protein